MPQIRYWQICRYYKYLSSPSRKSWDRAFEVRMTLPLPAEWDEKRVKEEIENRLAEIMDKALIEAIEDRFPDSPERQELLNAVMQSPEWGEVGGKRIRFATINTGWESTRKIEEEPEAVEIAEIDRRLDTLGLDVTNLNRRMEDINYPAIKESIGFAQIEYRMMRAQKAARVREQKRARRLFYTATRSAEFEVIDKTGKYPTRYFPYNGNVEWRVPKPEGEEE